MYEDSAAKLNLQSSELEEICRRTLRARFSLFRDMDVHASFYSYVGMTHRIRKKGSAWVIRVSDYCSTAPVEVLEAVAVILGYKILQRRPPSDVVEVYQRFCDLPEVQRRIRTGRMRRGRKIIRSPRGRHHSLDDLFRDLNRRFFRNQIELNRLGWSPRAGWRRLGHYDPLHQTITISPVLDSPEVPENVISYVLFHEMLHVLFGERKQFGSRHHPQEFQRTERAFPGYAEAKDFLREFCRNRGRYKK